MDSIQKLKIQIKKALRFLIKNILLNRKFITCLIVGLFFYRLKNMPYIIASSDFMNFILTNAKKISAVVFLEGDTAIVKTVQNYKYMASFHPSRLNQISDTLMNNKIPFNYLTGIPAYISNPFIHTALLGAVFMGVQLHYSNQSRQTKYINNSITDEEFFILFVCNDQVKKMIKLIIDQLRNPERYQQRKIKTIRGCLVYGDPGTGKTHLAKCLSKIEGITFVSTCASEFMEIFVGTGPKKIREYFQIARDNRPAIIFIDELDSIGIQRPRNNQSYNDHSERYSTLNQLLSEMDGVNDNENIVVLAATNRQDLLDSALVRSGRFDVKIDLKLPDVKMKVELYNLYLNSYEKDIHVNEYYILELAQRSSNFSGADIENLVNRAGSLVLLGNKTKMGISEIEAAFKEISDNLRTFRMR